MQLAVIWWQCIITHTSLESLSNVRRNLKMFISGHVQWINSVDSDILAKKKIKFEEYCIGLEEIVTPVD